MADLGALIRYRKHVVDEKQKVLSQLYRDAERIEQTKQTVVDQINREQALAEELNSPETHAHLIRFLEGARKKVRALESSLKKMETRIAAAQEDMRAAFAEMKKIQITQDRRDAEEDAQNKKKEDAVMDDIGLGRFNRKDD